MAGGKPAPDALIPINAMEKKDLKDILTVV